MSFSLMIIIVSSIFMILSVYAGLFFLSNDLLTEKERNIRVNISAIVTVLSTLMLILSLIFSFFE